MRHALIENGAVKTYPYSFSQLRRDNPGISFSEDAATAMQQAADLGVVEVTEVTPPTVDETTENVNEGTPALVNGVWTQVWSVVNAPADVIARRQEVIADNTAEVAVKADAWVKAYVAMTPAEAAAYVNANVTNLATAKDVIAKLAFMVNVLARRSLR